MFPPLAAPPPAPADPGRPVVLLHGFASSPRMLAPLARRLHRDLGRPVLPLALPAGVRDLACCAEAADRWLRRIARRPGFAPADVVGHSMGGLIATWWLKRVDRGRRLRRVVTLGTPHRGAPLARLGARWLGALYPALAQMAPEAAFGRSLRATPTPAGCEVIALCGGQDRLVPDPFARLLPAPGHRNAVLENVSHGGFLLSRAVFTRVAALLAAGPPITTASAERGAHPTRPATRPAEAALAPVLH